MGSTNSVEAIVADVRATVSNLASTGVIPNDMALPLQVVTLAGRTIIIRGFINGQYTVDVVMAPDIHHSLTISEHIPT